MPVGARFFDEVNGVGTVAITRLDAKRGISIAIFTQSGAGGAHKSTLTNSVRNPLRSVPPPSKEGPPQ